MPQSKSTVITFEGAKTDAQKHHQRVLVDALHTMLRRLYDPENVTRHGDTSFECVSHDDTAAEPLRAFISVSVAS